MSKERPTWRLALILAPVLLSLLAGCVRVGRIEPAPLWPSAPTYSIVRVPGAPPLDGAEAFSDELWGQAERMGPFFSDGAAEPAGRATQIRMLLHDGTLYIAGRCREASPEATEKDGGGGVLAFYFTQGPRAEFPYVRIEITAAGAVKADRYFRPYKRWREPIPAEHLDVSPIRVRTGRDRAGWWALAAVPLESFGIPESAFHANVVRHRPGGGTGSAWVDLRGLSLQSPYRFGLMRGKDASLAPHPRLAMPTALAVGVNRLRFSDWRDGYHLRANGSPVAVAPDGTAEVPVERRGAVSLEILDESGSTVATYSSNVRRPLTVEAVEPFGLDLKGPVAVEVRLNFAGGARADVSLQARQEGRVVGGKDLQLATGAHEVELPLEGATAGEIEIVAAARVPCLPGKDIALRATHWCVRGAASKEFDRFREQIDDLPTLSLYRAGLADACGFYRLLQGGDGRYRQRRRRGRRLGSSEWNFGMVYAFALLYKTDWPENPYCGDARFLASAVAGMDAGLDSETSYARGGYSRHLQPYLLTYELLEDDVSPETRRYWRRRLVEIVEHAIERYVHPASYLYAFYSLDVGTGTNHYAYYVASIYTAGRVLGRPDWLELGRERTLALAGHEQDGHFPERRGVPVTHYTWLTMNGLGQYWAQSGDESVVPALRRCAEFSCHTSLPDLGIMLLHDGRNNHYRRNDFGDFVLGLTARGRRLARRRARTRITNESRPSRSGPEYWFRTAENALYFREGPEEDMPRDAEFPLLDGRGLVARKEGFIYGLSAICVPPTSEELWLDPQNTIELHHARTGPILHGANAIMQPEAGSFFREVAGKTVFMPNDGTIERTRDGHFARLDFDTFSVRLTCRVLSETSAEIKVDLLGAEGEEPVVFNFFPAAKTNRKGTVTDRELAVTGDGTIFEFAGVKLQSSRPVEVDRDFKIAHPYRLRRTVDVKPVRAYVTLEEKRPLVLRISVSEAKD